MIALVKQRVRSVVSLETRMRLASWMTKQRWLPLPDHVPMGLIRDLQVSDPKQFHKFMWAHHIMGYARWYDSEQTLFAPQQMEPSRVEFFADMVAALQQIGVAPSSVSSVLEVGSSQGYLLRHLEEVVLTSAHDLVGIDIDAPAIEKGTRYLSGAGSKVRLLAGDMEDLDRLVGKARYDLTIAAGVLSYLNQADATRMVSRMLERTNTMLALAGLAWADGDNSSLTHSIESPNHGGQWLHNFDAMVKACGGSVIRNRWEGAKNYNNQTICFSFARPSRAQHPA
jgi:SAM-dependent methyltransferase